MDFFEVAKKMELESKSFYLEQAQKAPVAQLAGVFRFLADEEQKHYDLFTALQARSAPAPLRDSGILSRAKDAFAGQFEKFAVPDTINDYESTYLKALDKEQHAVAFYTAESQKLTDSRQRGDVVFVIEQEKKHVTFIQALLEFVRRPKEWIENAEFNHLDQY
jgi:rubrerythrin